MDIDGFRAELETRLLIEKEYLIQELFSIKDDKEKLELLGRFNEKYKEEGLKALDFAYEDIRNAFIYYLKNFNDNKPFIIASHSQGTVHAKRLISEFIDGKELQKKLIAAYLVGIKVKKNEFKNTTEGN